MEYKPAKSREPIEIGRTDAPLVILRSHPKFPKTLAPDIEGVWTDTNPAWPEISVDHILKNLDPPCHTDWTELKTDITEERDGFTGIVVYVRPGPALEKVKTAAADPRTAGTVH